MGFFQEANACPTILTISNIINYCLNSYRHPFQRQFNPIIKYTAPYLTVNFPGRHIHLVKSHSGLTNFKKMHNLLANTNLSPTYSPTYLSVEKITSNFNYSNILESCSIPYTLSGYYLETKPGIKSNGWTIYLSAIAPQIRDLLSSIIPLLAAENIPFKIVTTSQVAEWMLDGQLGSHYLGKIICLYPVEDVQFLKMTKMLIEATGNFRGPAIPSTIWLGSIVYTNREKTDLVPLQASKKPLIDIDWPFQNFILPKLHSETRLLNYKYYPISTIKKDAKGDVIKALYFKHFYQIGSCLIKQGRHDMFTDEYGRDIRDRLQWQRDLYHHLANDIPTPKVIDFFYINEDTYLVLDFVNAESLFNIISSTFQDRAWINLLPESKLKLINYFLRIIDIISILHKRNFIHRDITPANFIITNKGEIYLIDLELMWNASAANFSHPFKLGTHGYISPEQFKAEIPTYKEDVYAIAALLLQIFTNLEPIKFNLWCSDIAFNNVYFFTRNERISHLIKACLQFDCALRPNLDYIKEVMQSYRDQILKKAPNTTIHPSHAKNSIDNTALKEIIQAGLNGLGDRHFLDANNTWVSTPPPKNDLFGNENYETMICDGWYRGTAGPVWLVSIANNLGFSIQNCKIPYEQALAHLQQLPQQTSRSPFSLYFGYPGIAIAFSEYLQNKKNANTIDNFSFKNCFSKDLYQLGIANGIAGQGLALLKLQHLIDAPFITEFLDYFIKSILSHQQNNGSWELTGPDKKEDLTFNTGSLGILWFLLNSLDSNPDKSIRESTIKGLEYLLQKILRKNRNHFKWTTIHEDPNYNRWGACLGIPGVILILIKAYEVIGNESYKKISENYLHALPENPVLSNFGLSNGLAGLGELYLEAARTFQNRTWQDKANWILQLFINTIQYKYEHSGSWVVHASTTQTADLFSGNSGIIHFLLRNFAPNETAHVLAGTKTT